MIVREATDTDLKDVIKLCVAGVVELEGDASYL